MRCRSWGQYLSFAAFILLVFLSVALRRGTLGRVGAGEHEWLTAASHLHLTYWLKEGFLALKGALLCVPREFDYVGLAERGIYPSYPPGFLVPLFWIHRLLGLNEATVYLVQVFNVAQQLLIAFVLWFIFRKRPHGVIAGLVAAAYYLFHSRVGYFHTRAFFADQAILLVWLLWMSYEFGLVSRDRKNAPIVSVLFSFVACQFDYLGWVTAAVVALRQLVKRDLKSVAGTAVGTLAAVGVYFYQLRELGVISALRERFHERTSTNEIVSVVEWLKRVFVSYLGFSDLIILLGGLAVLALFRLRKKGDAIDAFFLFGLVTALIQIVGVRNHSWVHSFSVMKLWVVVAIVIGILTERLQTYRRRSGWIALLAIFVWSGVQSRSLMKALEFQPLKGHEVMEWIAEHQQKYFAIYGDRNIFASAFPFQYSATGRLIRDLADVTSLEFTMGRKGNLALLILSSENKIQREERLHSRFRVIPVAFYSSSEVKLLELTSK